MFWWFLSKSNNMDKRQIWQAVLGEIEITISKANFVTWFNNTYISSIENGDVVIAVPHGFSKEWLENKYDKFIRESLVKYYGEIKNVTYRVSSQVRLVDGARQNMGPLESSALTQKQTQSVPIRVIGPQETNLNTKYTFDNYVVGSHNELAMAACESVAREPGDKYNPLFIYGGVGLGKTHLLQAIGNFVLQIVNGARVRYITSERFTSELIESIRKQSIDSFKRLYRDVDILLIDDIQFIGGKEKTQEEFFHIFNALYQQNKQIVLCSDRPPRSISTLEERLRSRFEGGMIIDVSKPDLETRIAILSEKARSLGFPLPYEVMEYMAQNIQNNVRELEGALNRYIATCQLRGWSPSLDNIEAALGPIIVKKTIEINSPQKIINSVAAFYNVDPQDVLGKGRRADIVKPRQVAIYLMRKEIKLSYPCIGRELGGRDHTTVLHAYRKIEKELDINEVFQQEVFSIKERFLL